MSYQKAHTATPADKKPAKSFRGGEEASWALSCRADVLVPGQSSGSNRGTAAVGGGCRHPFSGQTARMSVAQPGPAERRNQRGAEGKAREAASRQPLWQEEAAAFPGQRPPDALPEAPQRLLMHAVRKRVPSLQTLALSFLTLTLALCPSSLSWPLNILGVHALRRPSSHTNVYNTSAVAIGGIPSG